MTAPKYRTYYYGSGVYSRLRVNEENDMSTRVSKFKYVLVDRDGTAYPSTLANSQSECWTKGNGIVSAHEGRTWGQAYGNKPLSNSTRSAISARGWKFQQLVPGSDLWKRLVGTKQDTQVRQVYVGNLSELMTQLLQQLATTPTQPSAMSVIMRGHTAGRAAQRYRFHGASNVPSQGDRYLYHNLVVELTENRGLQSIVMALGTGISYTVETDKLGTVYPLVQKAGQQVINATQLQHLLSQTLGTANVQDQAESLQREVTTLRAHSQNQTQTITNLSDEVARLRRQLASRR